MQERCRLISESQWREYQECVQKMHQLEERLRDAESVIVYTFHNADPYDEVDKYIEKYGVEV